MKPFVFLLLMLPFWSAAQVIDDFSDGDFTNNPAWSGCDTAFIVNESQQLQLNASASGTAWLSVAYETTNEMEWRFRLRENFAPSSKNYCDIYLSSNNLDLTVATEAYFLRFGEAGTEDVIDLMRIQNGAVTSICRGKDTFVAAAFDILIKVERILGGGWKIFIDKSNAGLYLLEAEGLDNTFPISGTFGIKATYTSSNAKKIYFDDLYVGVKINDSVPPNLISYNVLDKKHIQLQFDESLDDTTSLNLNNYYIDNQQNKPDSVKFGDTHSTIILTYNDFIENTVVYTLYINNLEDLSGNIMEPTQFEFVLYEPQENDVVINEIMADPEPSVGLPPFEYVELYNTTDFPIDMKDWVFQIGSSQKIIENQCVIEPKGFLLLCGEDAVTDLSQYGNCYGFSSFQIANSGAYLMLQDESNKLIFNIEFADSWYNDSNKKDGGWSLEQIDPMNPCAGKKNWSASGCGAGGTPGSVNSIDALNLLKPNIERVNLINDYILEVYFDQKMDQQSIDNLEVYTVVEMDAHPTEFLLLPGERNFIELIFNQHFEPNRLYTLEISKVLNCSGLENEETLRCQFGLPDEVEANDIIINEILFNPIIPGVDYVELYNRSDKILNISDIVLGAIKSTFPNPPDTTIKEISSDNRIFLPHSYLLLSTNSNIVGKQYECSTDNFLEMSSFPTYPNEEGQVIICARNGSLIDKMSYTDKMHYPLLIETQGVALERINFDKKSSDLDNWHSASEASHFGTPGYKNSMCLTPEIEKDEISVSPEIFSPDGDGYQDITGVSYKLEAAGYTLNIHIFDSHGRLIKTLIDNTLISQQGVVVWDGLNEDGHRVSPGIYVIFTEVFDLQGSVKRYKNAVVVATK